MEMTGGASGIDAQVRTLIGDRARAGIERRVELEAAGPRRLGIAAKVDPPRPIASLDERFGDRIATRRAEALSKAKRRHARPSAPPPRGTPRRGKYFEHVE